MTFDEYLDIVSVLGEKRGGKSSRNLRPIQKNAIQKAKDLKK